MEVRPLSSGRSGAVSGEVSQDPSYLDPIERNPTYIMQLCLHLGPVESKPSYPLITRSAALQYRLTDSGAIFFNKGTSEGVL